VSSNTELTMQDWVDGMPHERASSIPSFDIAHDQHNLPTENRASGRAPQRRHPPSESLSKEIMDDNYDDATNEEIKAWEEWEAGEVKSKMAISFNLDLHR
jgi:hypothetical protein